MYFSSLLYRFVSYEYLHAQEVLGYNEYPFHFRGMYFAKLLSKTMKCCLFFDTRFLKCIGKNNLSSTGCQSSSTFTFEKIIIRIFERYNCPISDEELMRKKCQTIFLSFGSLYMDRKVFQIKIPHSQIYCLTHTESRTIGKCKEKSMFFIVYYRKNIFYLVVLERITGSLFGIFESFISQSDSI